METHRAHAAGEANHGIRTATARMIGKCKHCKKVHRVEGAWARHMVHKTVAFVGSTEVDLWKGRWQCSVECCRGSVLLMKVQAAALTTHECGTRCTNATGFLCECSCGGKNHGRG